MYAIPYYLRLHLRQLKGFNSNAQDAVGRKTACFYRPAGRLWGSLQLFGEEV